MLVGFLIGSVPTLWAGIQVSVEGEYVYFRNGNKRFAAPITTPTNLVAVLVVYEKRDFSEYILAPGLITFPEKHNNRWANDTEWTKLKKEWAKIQKQVTFLDILGGVKVDTFRRYTLLGTTTSSDSKLIHVFKVEYLGTGKEGVEVIDWNLFKMHPEENSRSFFLGRDNGRLVPVFQENGVQFVRVGQEE